MNLLLLPLILFIEGFVGLSYQMLYIRQLTPYVGNNVIVVSWIIGVFLVFLAIGYKKGGTFSGNVMGKLATNFMVAGAITGLGASSFFLELYFSLVTAPPQTIILLIYAILIIAPSVYLLGQTLPLITSITKGDSIGEISGNVLFLSTIGSFLGAIVTTNILMTYFGSSTTLAIASSMIIALVFILSPSIKKCLISMVIISSIVFCNTILFYKLYDHSTAFGDSKILEGGGSKALYYNKSYMSVLRNNQTTGYIRRSQEVLFEDLKIDNSEILVLGAGGFVLSHKDKSNNNFTYIDVDGDLKDIAEKDFLKTDINGEFIVDDASAYLIKSDKKYKVIYVDTFSSLSSVPSHMLSIETMNQINNDLTDDGYVVFNIIQDRDFKLNYSRTIHNTINKAFSYCYVENLGMAREIGNVLYLCQKKNNHNIDDNFYTNNTNTAGHDNVKFIDFRKEEQAKR
jgi:spermidine synthase